MAELKALMKSPAFVQGLADVIPAQQDRERTASRLANIALLACVKSPQLTKCTPTSIMTSVRTAAELGLDCGGALGSAYLVPFKTTCQLIIGYRGLIDLCRRSGEILKIEARVVYRNDEFQLAYGDSPGVRHFPGLEPPDDRDIVGVYAVATLKGGEKQIEWMTKQEVDGIRKRSRAGASGPWVTDYSEMAKKTVVRRLVKYLPLSTEMTQAQLTDFDSMPPISPSGSPVVADVTPTPPQERSDDLADQIAGQIGEPIDEQPQSPSSVAGTSGEGADSTEPSEEELAAALERGEGSLHVTTEQDLDAAAPKAEPAEINEAEQIESRKIDLVLRLVDVGYEEAAARAFLQRVMDKYDYSDRDLLKGGQLRIVSAAVNREAKSQAEAVQ